MQKYKIFTTFLEAKESESYDHLFQKAFGLATASGVDFALIRELGLHLKNEEGELFLDQYIIDNNIIVEFPDIYTYAKSYWKVTTAWASIYKYGESYVSLKDHSDRTYTVIELESDAVLLPVDENGDVIIIKSVGEI